MTHPSLRKLSYHTFESWTVVFNAPEDERWVIVKDYLGVHGLQHNCWDRLKLEPRYMGNDACSYCGGVPPESLEGFLKLVEWDK